MRIFNELVFMAAIACLAGCGSGEPASAARTTGAASNGTATSVQDQAPDQPGAPAAADAADRRSIKARAEKLLFDDKYDEAFGVLRTYMSQNRSDQEVRLYFGRLLYYDGRGDEAVKVWEEGLRKGAEDFDLLQNIGLVRLRQGVDGPSVYQWRGMRQVIESPGPEAEARYKQERLLLAVDALEKANRLRPDSIDAGQGLAQAYQYLGQWEEAIRVLRDLAARHAGNADLQVRLASALEAAAQPKQALAAIDQAFRLDPQCAAAFQFLAGYYQKGGNLKLAEENRRKAEFYGWLVAVGRVPFSEEYWRMYLALTGKGVPDETAAVEKLKADRRAAVGRLTAQDTPATRGLLATVCYFKRLDPPEIDRSMRALERWRADDALIFLMNKALAPDVRKRAFEWAVGVKDRRAFDPLAEIVRNDIRLSHTIEAAELLARLGDPRAVPILVEVLDPRDELSRQGKALADPTDAGWRVSRGRAAYALGAFDLLPARQALQAGLQNKAVAIFCHAGLYRLTRDRAHLEAIQTGIGAEPKFCQWLAAEAMRRLPEAEAHQFGKRWLEKMESEYQPGEPEVVAPK